MSNKIRVDPIDEDVPYDILEGQQIIYEPKANWNIDMDRNIEKIWQTPKLNFEKLSFDNLNEFLSKEKQCLAAPASQLAKESETNSGENKDNEDNSNNINGEPQDSNEEFDQKKFFELKQSISQAIELAHIEMGVALDALTLILSNSDQQQTADQPLPIPPKSITLTPANKPKAGHRALIHQSKLNLGSKKSQLTLASSLLRSGTTRLTKTIEVENTFWDQILQLSKLNWFIQKEETVNEKDPAQYFIDCGFSGSGSKLSYETYAYINREVDGKLNLLLKYEVEKAISVRLQPTSSLSKPLKDVPLPMLPKGIHYPQSFISSNLPTDPVVLEAHEKLCKARSTILETELFNYLTKESLSIAQCSHNISDSVYISINDDWELVFELKEVAQKEGMVSTHLHWLCSAIKTALLFKLREHHKHLDYVQKGLLHTHDCLGVDEIKRTIPVVQDPNFIQYSKDMVLYYFFLQEIDQAVQSVLDSFKSVSTICESFSSQSFFKIEYYPIEDPKSHHSILGHSLLIYIGRFNSINVELRAPNLIQLGIVEGNFAVETPNQLKKLLSKQISMILFG